MEAVMVKNQPVSGCNNYKQTRASRKKKNDNNTRSFSQKSSENQAPPSFHGSLLQTPHRSLSFSPSTTLSHPYLNQQKPPLLPLPAAAPMYRSSSLSSPPPPRDQSVNTPRKRRSQPNNPKPIVVAPTPRLGCEPVDLPKEAPKVLTSMDSPVVIVGDYLESFSGALSLLSPPPSSLPLPRFPLRPAPRCNAEVDAGATDDLRRLLRLH